MNNSTVKLKYASQLLFASLLTTMFNSAGSRRCTTTASARDSAGPIRCGSLIAPLKRICPSIAPVWRNPYWDCFESVVPMPRIHRRLCTGSPSFADASFLMISALLCNNHHQRNFCGAPRSKRARRVHQIPITLEATVMMPFHDWRVRLRLPQGARALTGAAGPANKIIISVSGQGFCSTAGGNGQRTICSFCSRCTTVPTSRTCARLASQPGSPLQHSAVLHAAMVFASAWSRALGYSRRAGHAHASYR